MGEHQKISYSNDVSMRNDASTMKARVLLADDHPGVLALVRRLLEQHDYDVVGSVENGARLLEEASRLQPDVVVVDVNMPIMDGIAACRELTRTMPRIRLIVLTVENDAAVRRTAFEAGALAFIEKRAAGTDLVRAIGVACDGQQP